MNNWNDLLIDNASFDRMPAEQLSSIGTAADCADMTIAHGISAIGNVLAIAALDKEVGLSMEVVADLGWLLESLGKLSASVTDRGNAARSYSDWHKAQKREV